MGEGELELCLPSPKHGRGAGGEGKDLILHWDAPRKPLSKRLPWKGRRFSAWGLPK
jgi:hypothetical protein